MMKTETCCVCGVEFGISQAKREDLLRCKNTFYCPNGHGQHFVGETDREKLEKLQTKCSLLSASTTRWEKLADERLVELNHLKKSVAYYKGKVTQLKARRK